MRMEWPKDLKLVRRDQIRGTPVLPSAADTVFERASRVPHESMSVLEEVTAPSHLPPREAHAPHGAGPAGAFRADVQGLRALAVAAVVLYHARMPLFGGGYVGVDVFFVISGYLITGLLLRELERSGKIDFAAFYARRIRRLLPAVTVMLLATLAGAWLFLSALDQKALAPSALYAALYASNFGFAAQATDYLAGDVQQNPVMHTWSLSVEEQFYVFWPLLLLLGARAGAAVKRQGRVAAVMVGVLVLSLAASLWVMRVSQPWAFFASPLRAWEFAIGALVLLGEARMHALGRGTKDALALAGAAAVLGAIVGFDDRTTFPGLAALLPAGGTALLLLAGAGSGAPGRVSRVLGAPVARWVGDLSYSWYLWHWPVLVLPALRGYEMGPAQRAGAVVLSLALAWASYRWVENRIRFAPRLLASPWRSIALGAGLTAVAAGGAVALQRSSTQEALRIERAGFYQGRKDLPRVWPDGCHTAFEGTAIAECAYGDLAAGRTMFLVGDSHAGQWFPALERIALEQKWRLVSLTKSACPLAEVTVGNSWLKREYRECATWRAGVMARIAKERPALVVLSNSAYYIPDPDAHVDSAGWLAGFRTTLQTLRRDGAAVVVLRDTPRPGFDMPNCLARALRLGKAKSTCDFARNAGTDAAGFALDHRAAESIDRVAFVDLSDAICAGAAPGRCAAMHDGHLTYRDGHHLTARMARDLGPTLLARIETTGLLESPR